MPPVTLVVCVHLQRDLLERLLRESRGCYDELIVLHDVPDSTNVRSVAEAEGGRFFERPPSFLQEPHWPFAWGEAKHEWILRFDADEFPSDEMKVWLREFRRAPEPSSDVSGFTCIWPLWNGKKMVSKRWPSGRIFLFHKARVRFFGMCEQVPVPDGRYEPVELVLHHRPKRKSYGLRNILLRKQSWNGAAFIAGCLQGKPTDLVCWRWDSEAWPLHWDRIRQRPLRTALVRFVKGTLQTVSAGWQLEQRLFLEAALTGSMHQAMICIKFWRMRRARSRRGAGME